MRIGIVCAAESELEPFFNLINFDRKEVKSMLTFNIGKMGKHEIVALYCGVGKVNAAIATQSLAISYQADIIINAGTAGGISSEVELFDTVVSTETACHDMDENIYMAYHPYCKSIYFKADERLVELSRQIPGNIHWGRMVTGDVFVADEGRQAIIEKFNPLSVDMESGSVAQVCYVNNIPFLSIRSITDTADHSGENVFEANCAKASAISANITVELIKKID